MSLAGVHMARRVLYVKILRMVGAGFWQDDGYYPEFVQERKVTPTFRERQGPSRHAMRLPRSCPQFLTTVQCCN